MPGRFAIFAASFIGIGSVSGIALGNYATTTSQAKVDATDIHDLSGQIGDTDARYSPAYPSATADMAPNHIPVCRKGCGPTLSQRQNAAYFDNGSSQIDRIYAAGADQYASDPVQVARVIHAPATVATVAQPRVTYGTPEAPCYDADGSCGAEATTPPN